MNVTWYDGFGNIQVFQRLAGATDVDQAGGPGNSRGKIIRIEFDGLGEVGHGAREIPLHPFNLGITKKR